ncbi:MAG TPA: recombinase family protein [Smithellaceae bacterium]|jgi:DNA invertase Pin-like site-specific DNA recombinase|nr:recombinase family protein [Smithellaceae bacterium]
MTTKHTAATGAKLAYSYRRFSSKKQGDGSSLERQLELAKEVCAEQGWRLIDIAPDEGVSAYKVGENGEHAANMHKGNLASFLARVRGGEIAAGSVLIVERLDRFSRNYFDIVFPVWLSLLQSGVEIYSCVSRTHYTLESIRKNPMLAGMALIEMASANEYSSGLSQRVKKAVGIRVAAASSGKKLPLGPWRPAWVDYVGDKRGGGEFRLNDHADTLRRIVREYLDGASMFAIARGLQRDGVPSMRGGTWVQGSVASLLHNPALAGDVTLKGVKVKGYLPSVISRAEHGRLLGKLADNRGRKGGGGKGERIGNLFRNRVRCSACGGAVATAGTGSYYFCRGRSLGRDCKAGGVVSVAKLELDFFTFVLCEHPAALLGKRAVKSSGAAAALKARMRDLDKAIEEAADLVGKLPIKALEAKLTALVKQREAVGRELEATSAKLLSAEAAPAAYAGIKAALSSLAGVANVEADLRPGSKAETDFVEAIEELRRQLADGETRKRLLNLLPSLVDHLELDIAGKRYRVVNHAGEASGWRQLDR